MDAPKQPSLPSVSSNSVPGTSSNEFHNIGDPNTVSISDGKVIGAKAVATELLVAGTKAFEYPTFSSDPAHWNKNDEHLKNHLASIKFPNRNIQSKFPESIRSYGDENRFLSRDLFVFKMSNGERVQRDWMIYSKSTGQVYCFVCKLFSTGNKSAFSNGFNNWRHGNVRATEHANSSDHFLAHKVWSARRNIKTRIDKELLAQYESECYYWRNVLKRVVTVVKFLSSRGLAFRGHGETFGSRHNGNYLGTLELISKFDPFLAEHIQKYGGKGQGHMSYFSHQICDQFIRCMTSKVQGEIEISVDSTPDVSHTDQLTFIVRYITKQGCPVERFMGFIDIHGHGSEYLADTVQNTLTGFGIDLGDCRGQTFDNANNMAWKYTGLQQRLRDVNPLAVYVPCCAHSLNLVGSCAAESCVWAITFFGFLQELYSFFALSNHRWHVLSQILPRDVPVPKHLSVTRWSARADACKALFKGYKHIKSALISIEVDGNQPLATRSEAGSYTLQMNKLEIGMLTVIWNAILERFNETSKKLQSSTMDIITAVRLYDSLLGYLDKLRDPAMLGDYESTGTSLSSTDKYSEEEQSIRRRAKFFDEPRESGVDTLQSASDKFRITVYYVILDSLLSELKKRRDAYADMSKKFGFLFALAEMSASKLMKCAKELQSSYPNDLNDTFPNEVVHFASYVESFNDVHPSNLLKVIREQELRDTFPNVDIALRLCLCNFATNCTGERSFSIMKRVKNELRSTSTQVRMSDLSLLCIERELAAISFEEIIDDFAKDKSRKKSM